MYCVPKVRQLAKFSEQAAEPAAVVARKHQISMQNILKWRWKINKLHEPKVEKSISMSFQSEAIDEIKRLQSEIKKLSKSLSNMTVDRDILKEAINYASKKKWI